MLRHLLKVLSLIIVAATPLSAMAVTPAEAFTKAPYTILPLLNRNTRLDMVDYFKAGSTHASHNLLYGESKILELTPLTIKAQVTDAQTVEMVLLPSGGDTLIAVINTILTPVPDSSVDVYSSSWKRQGAKTFVMPDISQWLRKGADRKRVDALLPLMLVKCEYDPATLSFVFTNDTAEYMGEEDYAPLRPLLRDYIVYAFDPAKRRLTPLPADAANPLAR